MQTIYTGQTAILCGRHRRTYLGAQQTVGAGLQLHDLFYSVIALGHNFYGIVNLGLPPAVKQQEIIAFKVFIYIF
jgi:hypothetical protein